MATAFTAPFQLSEIEVLLIQFPVDPSQTKSKKFISSCGMVVKAEDSVFFLFHRHFFSKMTLKPELGWLQESRLNQRVLFYNPGVRTQDLPLPTKSLSRLGYSGTRVVIGGS